MFFSSSVATCPITVILYAQGFSSQPWSSWLRKATKLYSASKSSVNCKQLRLGKCHKLLALNISLVWRLYVRDNGFNLRMAFYRKFNITHYAPMIGLLSFACANSTPQAMLPAELQRIVRGFSARQSHALLSVIWMRLKTSCKHSKTFWGTSDESVLSVKALCA